MLVAGDEHTGGTGVEEAALVVQVALTHGQIVGVELVVQHHRARPGPGVQLPAARTQQAQRHALGAQAVEVFREIAARVAAGNPHRQIEFVDLVGGQGQFGANVETVAAGPGGNSIEAHSRMG